MTAPRLLLVDDHAMFRTGVSLVIRSAIADAIIFSASSLQEALAVHSPTIDIVLLDIQLQGPKDSLSGLHCIPMLKQKWADVPVLMLSAQNDSSTIQLAIERGATAFISKSETADKITNAICQVLAGGGSIVAAPSASPKIRALTPRQCEVIELIHQGLPNKVIAHKLNLSDNTVRRHVQDILEFFDVNSRTEAVFMARRQGLVD
jgi:DNA-binding NarL/FixJ family response regulator